MTYKDFEQAVQERGIVKKISDRVAVNLTDFYKNRPTIGTELIQAGFCESEAMMKAYHIALYSIHNEPEKVNNIYLNE